MPLNKERKKDLIQTIQFSKSSSIKPIDRALSRATIPDQSGLGSNGNEVVLRIPKAPASLEPHQQIV